MNEWRNRVKIKVANSRETGNQKTELYSHFYFAVIVTRLGRNSNLDPDNRQIEINLAAKKLISFALSYKIRPVFCHVLVRSSIGPAN